MNYFKISLALFGILIIVPSLVMADTGTNTAGTNTAGNPSSQSSINLTNPLGSTKDVPTLIGQVINGVLGVVGSLALLMFIYGGFMWMLSAGNEKMVEKGKNTLMWAAAGLVVIFMSYTLVKFIIDQL